MLYQLSYAHHKRKCGMARLRGLEPLTHGLEVRCSIRLSYRRKDFGRSVLVGARGFEPPTPCAQGRCATRLRYTPISSPLRLAKTRRFRPERGVYGWPRRSVNNGRDPRLQPPVPCERS